MRGQNHPVCATGSLAGSDAILTTPIARTEENETPAAPHTGGVKIFQKLILCPAANFGALAPADPLFHHWRNQPPASRRDPLLASSFAIQSLPLHHQHRTACANNWLAYR